MRAPVLALAVVFALATPVPAADAPEDQAKAAAVASLKAVKAKDLDALMKTTATPFVHREENKPAVHKDEAALKAWLKDKLDTVTNVDKVPTEVGEIVPFATIKEKIKDATDLATVEGAVGKDGFVVTVKADGKNAVILVRVEGGKARIVGLVI